MINKSNWAVEPVPQDLDEAIWSKINQKTKPVGALGVIEEIAFRVARIQRDLSPSLKKPTVVVFAGDHGIAKSGVVNPYPQEVTYQMVMNFLQGGAAINVLARSAGMNVQIVDAGVNHSFDRSLPLVHAKLGNGTKDYRYGNAMDIHIAEQGLVKGAEIVNDLHNVGVNVLGFGEMGIGNSSSAALIMSQICNLPIDECVGRGTGAEGDFLNQKIKTLQEVVAFHQLSEESTSLQILVAYGGFEIAQMAGGMLKAASLGHVILVDGFISTSAYLIAHKINPAVKEFALFAHQSNEQGHIKMLQFIGAEPILQLALRLGEGTGCAAAFPIIKMAVDMLNDMASFESAGVSKSE